MCEIVPGGFLAASELLKLVFGGKNDELDLNIRDEPTFVFPAIQNWNSTGTRSQLTLYNQRKQCFVY